MSKGDERPTVLVVSVDLADVVWVVVALGTLVLGGWFAWCLDWRVLCGLPGLWCAAWLVWVVFGKGK